MEWMESLEFYFNTGITLTIHVLELMGVIIIIGALRDFFCFFAGRGSNIRLDLAQSMALGLEFKLGGEILRTVIARDWNEILIVGAIIALRSALNFLIHWEIRHIQHDDEILHEAVLHDAPKEHAQK